jgi:AcrR family transcriptional regulator
MPPRAKPTKRTNRRSAPKPANNPSRRARNKEAVHQRIITAALQLFESRGFDATTTKEIARRARVAEGTVFNYFETKEDIALHFFEQEVDHAISAVRANRRLRKAPLEERLFALVQSQIEFLAPYERFIGAAFVRALRPDSKLAFSTEALALRTRYVAFVQELIDESLPRQRSQPLGWVAPQAFWIFYLGVLLYWLHDSSTGKQSTLAFLDRSLKIGAAILGNHTL